MTLDTPTRTPQVETETAATYRLRTGLYVLPHGDDEVFVRDGSRAAFSKLVRDPSARRLLARVVQTATEPVTAAGLADAWSADADDVAVIIGQLAEAGVLTRTGAGARVNTVALLGEGCLADTLTTLAAADDRLIVERHADLDALFSRITDDEAPLDLLAVVADRLDPALFLDVNALCLEHTLPAVFAHVDGTEAVIGPLVIPGETACYLCHDLQDEGARHLRDEFLVYKDSLRRGVPGPGADPAVAALAAAWLRLALAKHDPGVRGFLDQRLLRVESSRMEVMTHRILTIPRCPACAGSRPELEHTFL